MTKNSKELTLNQHQANCAETAMYPGRGTIIGLIYSLIELAGEVGEACNKFKKAMRDDPKTIALLEEIVEQYEERLQLEPERVEVILKELRGVTWSLNEVFTNLDVSHESVAEAMYNELSKRKEEGKIQGDGDNR